MAAVPVLMTPTAAMAADGMPSVVLGVDLTLLQDIVFDVFSYLCLILLCLLHVFVDSFAFLFFEMSC